MAIARLPGLKIAFVIFLCLVLGALIFRTNGPSSPFQKRIEGLPFGFFTSAQGGISTQDFSYNLVYFQGIRQHVVPRPYRLEDQQKLVRQLLPRLGSGISHAYSPVAFLLATPLLRVSPQRAYALYCLIGAAAILFLFQCYLLPRAVHPLQLGALGVCAVSVCMELSFFQGQSSLVTTPLLGFFWMLLQKRPASRAADLGLAVLFWALCLKPSVAVIPLVLLLGARAWRPLAGGVALLVASWLAVAPLYGGWWTGLQDYLHLLNHYNNADFTPFMRRDYLPGHDDDIRRLFNFDRATVITLSLALLFLRWTRTITLSGLFQSMIGVFLLFSPYLLPSEDWILCLLVVEGDFFRGGRRLVACAKLLVLFGILDLRAALVVPWQINFELKCLLFGWMLVEALRRIKDSSAAK